MAVGDVYQIQVGWKLGSQLTMNVLHAVETTTCTDDIPAETVAKIMYAEIGNWFTGSNLFSEETQIITIGVRRIHPTSGVPSLLVLGTTGFPVLEGSGTGGRIPSQAALLLSLYTAVNTKNGRGRVYWPGLTNSIQDDGQLLQAGLDETVNMVAMFESDLVAVGPMTGEFHMVVWSRELTQANEVTQAIVHTNLATQRGRRNFPGVGT